MATWEQAQERLRVILKECSEPDWDGYGCLSVSPEVVESAAAFLGVLENRGMSPPGVGANGDGGVILDWEEGGYLEAEIESDDPFKVYWMRELGEGDYKHWEERIDASQSAAEI